MIRVPAVLISLTFFISGLTHRAAGADDFQRNEHRGPADEAAGGERTSADNRGMRWPVIFVGLPIFKDNVRGNQENDAFGSVFGDGLSVGVSFPWSRSWQLELESGKTKISTSFFHNSIDYQSLWLSAQTRYFAGNSLNLMFGLGAELWQDRTLLGYGPVQRDIGLSYGIGNEWTFDAGVVLGVDWLAVESGNLVGIRSRVGLAIK